MSCSQNLTLLSLVQNNLVCHACIHILTGSGEYIHFESFSMKAHVFVLKLGTVHTTRVETFPINWRENRLR